MMLQRTVKSPSAIADLFSLVVPQAWAIPETRSGEASVFVALLCQPLAKKAVVMLTDGSLGAPINNAANEIVALIHQLHLEPHGIAVEHVRWIWRDSDGLWDEMVPNEVPGRRSFVVRSRPLGGRSLDDALAYVAEGGIILSREDRHTLDSFLKLKMTEEVARS